MPTRRHRSLIVLAPATLALLAGCSGPAQPGDITGRYIVTISDADMAASALITGQLGPRPSVAQDTFTVIELPIREPATPYAQIPVSNSIIGPPNQLSVTRDGRTAYVVETRGMAPPDAVTVKDLPPGRSVFAIDMSDPLRPEIRSSVLVGSAEPGGEPLSVDAHPAGDLVAIARREPGQQIVIVPTSAGTFGTPLAFSLGELGAEDTSAVPSLVAWHPDGRHLAVTLPERDQVLFLEFTREGNAGGMGLARWGAPVNVGRYPYTGAFTPDGKYFIVSEAQIGADLEDVLVSAPVGRASVIRLSDQPSEMPAGDGAPVPTVVHEIVSSAPGGMSPQGIAISPDGRLVATANMRRSFFPDDDPRQTRGGSLSLFTLDSKGQLAPAGEYEMLAMPVGLSFDRDGRFVVVTMFRSFDPEASPEFGELGFWRVNGNSLEKTDIYVGVGKGPHGVVIVR